MSSHNSLSYVCILIRVDLALRTEAESVVEFVRFKLREVRGGCGPRMRQHGLWSSPAQTGSVFTAGRHSQRAADLKEPFTFLFVCERIIVEKFPIVVNF